ncbi:MAG: tetratricopeptide repeat protein [Phycisphaerales bacterium]|nr:tetratricopeptide repeat protein [Phycisphaerales bacterium]
MAESTVDLAGFFSSSDVSPKTLANVADSAFATAKDRIRFIETTNERASNGGAPLLVGAARFLLGDYNAALESLKNAPKGADRALLTGDSLLALGRVDEAIAEYEGSGAEPIVADMRIAYAAFRAGAVGRLKKLVEKHDKAGASIADWHFARGLLAEANDEREAAASAYARATELNPEHERSMFRAAWMYDSLGDEETAIEMYERLSRKPRCAINALINLAVIYEDNAKFDEAAAMLSRVLGNFPSHTRARLFLKDVQSSQEMMIDDVAARRAEKRRRLLETPVSDFELSVRARNCLKKMRVITLGDLLKLTEAELLSYKNFGDTSLTEIKAMLERRGLELGMDPNDIDVTAYADAIARTPGAPAGGAAPGAAPSAAAPAVSHGDDATMARPVSELELSVRSRRCLQRLNIVTMGDLVSYSEAELLAARNFGQTSLNEIKSRLSEYGLQLAPKR